MWNKNSNMPIVNKPSFITSYSTLTNHTNKHNKYWLKASYKVITKTNNQEKKKKKKLKKNINNDDIKRFYLWVGKMFRISNIKNIPFNQIIEYKDTWFFLIIENDIISLKKIGSGTSVK